jgi:hypothetical protein
MFCTAVPAPTANKKSNQKHKALSGDIVKSEGPDTEEAEVWGLKKNGKRTATVNAATSTTVRSEDEYDKEDAMALTEKPTLSLPSVPTCCGARNG